MPLKISSFVFLTRATAGSMTVDTPDRRRAARVCRTGWEGDWSEATEGTRGAAGSNRARDDPGPTETGDEGETRLETGMEVTTSKLTSCCLDLKLTEVRPELVVEATDDVDSWRNMDMSLSDASLPVLARLALDARGTIAGAWRLFGWTTDDFLLSLFFSSSIRILSMRCSFFCRSLAR